MTAREGSIEILASGQFSILVDNGRTGYQALGITDGGPMDRLAFDTAQSLTGNHQQHAGIEICDGEFACRMTVDCAIALTGAKRQCWLDEMAAPVWQTLMIKQGQVLRLGPVQNGMRTYLVVAGTLSVSEVFGSLSTVVREHLGGLDARGSVLKPGDHIPFVGAPKAKSGAVQRSAIPDYPRELTLHLITGAQFSAFDRHQTARLFAHEYLLTPAMDRMGYRLSGPPIQPPKGSLRSEGLVLGSVQIPPDGQPIIMMCDRQTIGGYHKVGAVLSLDIATLAQMRPGSCVRFAPITVHEAQQRLQLHSPLPVIHSSD